MADVTFGVKVPEEMKIELSELMKHTELSGKEFMGMLLATYKLESNKKEKTFYQEDISELQRLLNRIQAIYLNLGQKTEFMIEERLQEGLGEVQKKEEAIKSLEEEIEKLKEGLEEKEKALKKNEDVMASFKQEQNAIKEELEQAKGQLKNNQLLYKKYETEIERLQEEIAGFGRLTLEIEERNTENQKLKTRNDELASDMWFLQREMDKLKEEREKDSVKLQEENKQLKQNYELELKNQLLEQKLAFNAKLELLKEENFKIQQEYAQKMQVYLENSLKKAEPTE